MTELLIAFVVGWFILIAAIFMNWLVFLVKQESWYGYLKAIRKQGFIKATKSLNLGNLAFLYIIYPIFLGIVAMVIRTLLRYTV